MFRKTRPLVFFAMVGMQLGILSVIDLSDLTLGGPMAHLFVFDPRWIPLENLPERQILR
jgi:hypothetical protein